MRNLVEYGYIRPSVHPDEDFGGKAESSPLSRLGLLDTTFMMTESLVNTDMTFYRTPSNDQMMK